MEYTIASFKIIKRTTTLVRIVGVVTVIVFAV